MELLSGGARRRSFTRSGALRFVAVIGAAVLLISSCSSGTTEDPGGGVPGVSDTHIYIGITYYERGSESGAVFGSSATGTDARRVQQAIVDTINDNGGILGRQIVPVYYVWNPDAGDTAVNEQELCSLWTEDVPVFAAWIMTFQHTEAIIGCLENAGVLTYLAEASFDDDIWEKYPNTVGKDTSTSRAAAASVDRLAEEGYFTDDAVVGLVTYDVPEWLRSLEEDYKPALERHGVELAEEVALPRPYFLDQLGATAAASQNAILRFQEAGVTHLLFFENSGALQVVFAASAERQNFRPRWGLTGMSEYAGRPSSTPVAQLEGAIGLGWRPAKDIEEFEEPEGETAEECRAMWRAKGLDPDYALCDFVNVFLATVEEAGELSRASFVEALPNIQDDIEPLGYTGFDFSRRDFVDPTTGNTIEFFMECECYRYTS